MSLNLPRRRILQLAAAPALLRRVGLRPQDMTPTVSLLTW